MKINHNKNKREARSFLLLITGTVVTAVCGQDKTQSLQNDAKPGKKAASNVGTLLILGDSRRHAEVAAM